MRTIPKAFEDLGGYSLLAAGRLLEVLARANPGDEARIVAWLREDQELNVEQINHLVECVAKYLRELR